MLAIAIFLSGCASKTTHGIFDNMSIYSRVDRDKVVAFGKIADSGDIVMIGQKFTYKLAPNSSHKIATLAEGNFTSAFTATEVVRLILKTDKSYSAKVKLGYTPQNDDEYMRLEILEFYCVNGRCQNELYLSGEIFGAVNVAKNELAQSIDIDIVVQDGSRADTGKLIEKIISTPATLALDVILLPFVIVGMLASAVQ